MAILVPELKLLFIMTPRTACTAIGQVLINQFGGVFLPKEDIVDSKGFILVQKKHSNLEQLFANGLLSKAEASSLLKFCYVRNPFDSLVSLYIKKRFKYQPLLEDPLSWVNRLPHYASDMKYCKKHSFNAWILKSMYKQIIKRLLGQKPSFHYHYTKYVDCVLRYENLNEGFRKVLQTVGVYTKITIPTANPTNERTSRDYHQYYSKVSRQIIEFVYKDELNLFNYRF